MKTSVLVMALSDLVLRASAYVLPVEIRQSPGLSFGLQDMLLVQGRHSESFNLLNPTNLVTTVERPPPVCLELAQKGVQGITIYVSPTHPPNFERRVKVDLGFKAARNVWIEFKEQEDGTIQIRNDNGSRGAITEDEAMYAHACLREALASASQCTWMLMWRCNPESFYARSHLIAYGMKHRQRVQHIESSTSMLTSYLTTPVDIWMDEHLSRALKRIK
jgi:hypothetical protein